MSKYDYQNGRIDFNVVEEIEKNQQSAYKLHLQLERTKKNGRSNELRKK